MKSFFFLLSFLFLFFLLHFIFISYKKKSLWRASYITSTASIKKEITSCDLKFLMQVLFNHMFLKQKQSLMRRNFFTKLCLALRSRWSEKHIVAINERLVVNFELRKMLMWQLSDSILNFHDFNIKSY